MTSHQTIDGVMVPRDLLERFVSSVEAHCYGFEGLDEVRALLDADPVAPEYQSHMGEAMKVFEALKVAMISRRVDREYLGPMGATEIQTWSTAIGVTLEMRSSMGGCTLIIRHLQGLQS